MKQQYSQDWKSYDMAKTKESIMFKAILWDLLELYFSQEIKTGKRVSNKDRLFMMALKVYYNVDFRKCKGIIEEITGRNVSYKSLANFFEDSNLETYIDDLILITSLPLSSMEKTAAIDATGFSTSEFQNWNEFKWGKLEGKERVWRKLHAICGCKTNCFISVKVTEKNVHDIIPFEEVIGGKMKYFDLEDFVADKAYSSKKVLNFLSNINLNPIIPFKKNVTGKSRGSYIWMNMFKYFRDNREEFDIRYHLRSNVETCFSMLKKRYGNNVRTKSLVSNVNEIKVRCLCHNICVLIQEFYENGLFLELESCVNRINTCK